MTEAVRLIVDYAFHELKLHRIEAGVMPRNLGSMRVLEKLDFIKRHCPKNVKSMAFGRIIKFSRF